MQTAKLIAFPQSVLEDIDLGTIVTTRLKINGQICAAVKPEDLVSFCKKIGYTKSGLKYLKTDFEGILFARLGRVKKATQSRDDLSVLRRKYFALCGSERHAKNIQQLQQDIAFLSRNVESYQNGLVGSLRELNEKQVQLSHLQAQADLVPQKYADEFEQLMKHPDIKELKIVGDTVHVLTQLICISYGSSVYEIGCFQITIDTASNPRYGIRMRNLTRRVAEFHHPHVNGEGVPCLGNIQEVIPHLIAEHRYAALISVCIQYLKSYENSDAYVPYREAQISRWPKCKTAQTGPKKEVMR